MGGLAECGHDDTRGEHMEPRRGRPRQRVESQGGDTAGQGGAGRQVEAQVGRAGGQERDIGGRRLPGLPPPVPDERPTGGAHHLPGHQQRPQRGRGDGDEHGAGEEEHQPEEPAAVAPGTGLPHREGQHGGGDRGDGDHHDGGQTVHREPRLRTREQGRAGRRAEQRGGDRRTERRHGRGHTGHGNPPVQARPGHGEYGSGAQRQRDEEPEDRAHPFRSPARSVMSIRRAR